MNIPSFTVLGAGPTVLMLHGIGGGHLAFAPQVESLASAGYREHDRNAPPPVMKKMAAAIPGSTFLEMPGVGHLQNLEAPDDFDALVLNFLTLPPALLH